MDLQGSQAQRECQKVLSIRMPERPAADRAALRVIRANLAAQVQQLKLMQQAATDTGAGFGTTSATTSTAPTVTAPPAPVTAGTPAQQS